VFFELMVMSDEGPVVFFELIVTSDVLHLVLLLFRLVHCL
jgi:hypothetical protein